MATYIAEKLNQKALFGGVPYGNVTKLHFNLTLASGVPVGVNKSTALIATDIVNLGILPAGAKIIDAVAIVSAAGTATTTMDLGYLYVDGDDVTAHPEDADGIMDAAVTSAIAVLRKNKGIAPVTLDKDAYLVFTNNTATQATSMVIDFFIEVELVGPK